MLHQLYDLEQYYGRSAAILNEKECTAYFKSEEIQRYLKDGLLHLVKPKLCSKIPAFICLTDLGRAQIRQINL